MAANSLIIPSLSETLKLTGQSQLLATLHLPSVQPGVVKRDGVQYAVATSGLLVRSS